MSQYTMLNYMKLDAAAVQALNVFPAKNDSMKYPEIPQTNT